MERLKATDPCKVKVGNSFAAGTIVEVLPKGYLVEVSGVTSKYKATHVYPAMGAAQLLRKSPIRSSRKPKPGRAERSGELSPKARQMIHEMSEMVVAHIEKTATDKAVARLESAASQRALKPQPPQKSRTWLDFVRRLPCCFCGKAAPSDPHHHGKRGVGQKVRDTLCIPLCRDCHTRYTNTGCVGALDRAATATRLLFEQHQLLKRVFQRLTLEVQAVALSIVLADLPPDALDRAITLYDPAEY